MFEVSSLTETNYIVMRPHLWLMGFALLVMIIDMFSSDEQPRLRVFLPWVTLVGVLVTGWQCLQLLGHEPVSFQGAAVLDRYVIGVALVVLVATGLSVLLSTGYMPKVNKQLGEYYALLLLCALGMMAMGSATDLITVFLALETFSLALYILSGLNRASPRSTESAMKYFLLGAFASGFFAYGAALIYGATGSTQFNAIAETLASGNYDTLLLFPGIALLLVGFGFKVSMVPFHMWTPDVYQGAPTPVTAFMSVGTKVAAFAAFSRFLMLTPEEHKVTVGWILAFFALLTMTLGNFAAMQQSSLKRLLAYSSIAHAGYILVGLVPGTEESISVAIFYLFVYAFMNIGAFAIVIMLENKDGDAMRDVTVGLGKRWPLLAMIIALFMFSLSGMPPLAGFWGKVFVFKAAVNDGWIVLTILAVINSAVSAYYYLRITIAMYFEEPGSTTATERQSWPALNIGLALTAIFTVLIGILPGMWTGLFLQ